VLVEVRLDLAMSVRGVVREAAGIGACGAAVAVPHHRGEAEGSGLSARRGPVRIVVWPVRCLAPSCRVVTRAGLAGWKNLT
jgi:hypothetical protein